MLFPLLVILFSCKNTTKPEPIYLPVSTARYNFVIPAGSTLKPSRADNTLSEWHVLQFDSLNAELYLTYTQLGKERKLDKLVDDAASMAVKHARFATALDRQSFSDAGRAVWGNYFRISGQTASPIQFFATDSSRNWLRGALYLTRPDSSGTRIHLLEADIKKMLGSLRWKKTTTQINTQ
ncbi:hypothetical protein C7T94_04460 [Pedobacter yulinensis]|uniref:Gliding motility lipoprotein GldD n=1 Tax=Pedobacter yulinensis TaxID=2126353 RepID=A0A2T3HNH1_9SPHI|nr:hypothetical protein [Pedobacter yulinensis]PST83995.1 hypothetical protein C7T94_04460 [Pedobacter yulinensis]